MNIEDQRNAQDWLVNMWEEDLVAKFDAEINYYKQELEKCKEKGMVFIAQHYTSVIETYEKAIEMVWSHR